MYMNRPLIFDDIIESLKENPLFLNYIENKEYIKKTLDEIKTVNKEKEDIIINMMKQNNKNKRYDYGELEDIKVDDIFDIIQRNPILLNDKNMKEYLLTAIEDIINKRVEEITKRKKDEVIIKRKPLRFMYQN